MPRKLTNKQEAYKNNRIKGMGVSEAYKAAYPNQNMNDKAVSVAANKLEHDPRISLAVEQAKEEATERALVTVEDVVKGLLAETKKDVEGSTHSGRINAWGKLSDFTGSFDANRQKLDVKGNIVLADLSGDELDRRIAELERKKDQ